MTSPSGSVWPVQKKERSEEDERGPGGGGNAPIDWTTATVKLEEEEEEDVEEQLSCVARSFNLIDGRSSVSIWISCLIALAVG